MSNQFSPGLPKWLESVKVNIGFPVVRTDGKKQLSQLCMHAKMAATLARALVFFIVSINVLPFKD